VSGNFLSTLYICNICYADFSVTGSVTAVHSNGATTLPYSAQHPKQVESSLAATLCRARLQTRVAVFNGL
jgi:hypothetical protein